MEQKLGILGGMGPQATISLYQQVVNHTEASKDQEHLPTHIYSDAKIPDRTAAILGGDEEACFQRLLAGAQALESAGCTAMAMPCNTAHYFVDRIQAHLTIPIVHMLRETAKELKALGRKRVGVMATDGTIQTGLYQRECEALGMEAIAPSAEVQKLVMSIIYDDIKKGGKGDPEVFAVVDKHFRELGCDGVILACTELSVYRDYHPLPDFYTDPLVILSRQCIQVCGYPLRQMG